MKIKVNLNITDSRDKRERIEGTVEIPGAPLLAFLAATLCGGYSTQFAVGTARELLRDAEKEVN